jgi:DNA-binding transcriptional LysR family regulator
MDFASLQIFRAVVAEGGIGRAASKLHRVQSNVTTRIKQLEQSLDVELFIRDKKRLILSPAGKVLLDYADRILHLASEAELAVKSEEPCGELRLGSMESTAASRLPPILSAYHKRFPAVRIELVTATSQDLERGVRGYDLDAAFVADPAGSEEISAVPGFAEELVLISGPDHPAIGSAKDVADKTILAFKMGCAYRNRLQNWFAESRVSPHQILELGSYHAILACAAAGTGIAIVPRSVLEMQRSTDVRIHLLPAKYSEVETRVIWRTNRSSAALRALLAVLVAFQSPQSKGTSKP